MAGGAKIQENTRRTQEKQTEPHAIYNKWPIK